jgi:hypothetical protein
MQTPNHDPNDSGRQQRERERESDMGVCFFRLFIFMEFTTQGGAFQVLLISAFLHTSPKRIKANKNIQLESSSSNNFSRLAVAAQTICRNEDYYSLAFLF